MYNRTAMFWQMKKQDLFDGIPARYDIRTYIVFVIGIHGSIKGGTPTLNPPSPLTT
jgi:hypothetical protein